MKEQELYELCAINVVRLCVICWFKVGVHKTWVPGHQGSWILYSGI
jgi:hypothetical protein